MNCDVAVNIGNSIFGVPFSGDFFEEVKKLNKKKPVPPYLFVQRRNDNLMYYAWSFYTNEFERVSIYACFNGVMVKPDTIISLFDAIFSIEGNGNSMFKKAEKLLRSSDVVCEQLPPIDYENSKSDVFVNSRGIVVKNILSYYVKYNSRIAIPLKKSEPEPSLVEELPPQPRLVKEFPPTIAKKEIKKDKNPDRYDIILPIVIVIISFCFGIGFVKGVEILVNKIKYSDNYGAAKYQTETVVETAVEIPVEEIPVEEIPVEEIPVEDNYMYNDEEDDYMYDEGF